MNSASAASAASASRVAVLAGGSGLVGRELARLLADSPHYERVLSLARRPSSAGQSLPPKFELLVVDFEQLPTLPRCDDVYIALGTTIDVAGSPAAFRRVDHDYVVNVARAARKAGATRLAVVSALGANPSSRVFYNRVKGEMQEAVKSLGYESVVIAMPSLLLGNRQDLAQPTRQGEVWARRLLTPVASLIPRSFRPVTASDVAMTLLVATLRGDAGVTTIASRDLHAPARPRR